MDSMTIKNYTKFDKYNFFALLSIQLSLDPLAIFVDHVECYC